MRTNILRTPVAACAATILCLSGTAQAGRPASGPTGFVPNMGQIVDASGVPDAHVAFVHEGPGLNVQLRSGGFAYDTWRPIGEENGPSCQGVAVHRIDVSLEGHDPRAVWQPFEPSADVLNYYTDATGEAGITGVHHYRRVLCKGIYPFIDLEFHTAGDGTGVKYDFIVHPGGDPANIRMRYEGARSELDDAGAAVSLTWADGMLVDRMPNSYWDRAGRRSEASVPMKRIGEGLFTFELEGAPAPWADDRSLIIDPVPTLQWGTYYGNGDHFGSLNAVAIDGAGNTIAVGTAGLTGLATSGAHDVVLSGTTDALLVKLNSSGQRIWATYLGGSNSDFGHAVGLDANGTIHIAGETWSSTGMATSGAHQTVLAGAPDAFLAKFSPGGTRLWSTYYGGAGDDRAFALAVDGSGEPAIAGTTTSTSGIASSSAADAVYSGNGDAFLAKFLATGAREWATYLGGTGRDDAKGLGCDNTYFFLTGATSSSSGIALGGTHQTTLQSGGTDPVDAYVIKYSGLGQKLWGSYFGGAGADRAKACFAELLTGRVYVVGETSSNTHIASFGAHQTGLGGNADGFLLKLDNAGAREWSTYLGGGNNDVINAVSVGSSGRVVVAGTTDSPSAIATSGALSPALAGSSDAFIDCFNPSGARLWGTYYGGAGYDAAHALAVNGLEMAIGGITGSSTGIATAGTFQASAAVSSGNYAKYVARFTGPLFLPATMPPESGKPMSMRLKSDESGFFVPCPEGAMISGEEVLFVRLVDASGRIVLEERMTAASGGLRSGWNGIARGAFTVVIDGTNGRWISRLFRE